GLGVSASRPLYVHTIDAAHNVVELAENDDLNASALIADTMVWSGDVVPDRPFEASVKIRLASPPVPVQVEACAPKQGIESGNPAWRMTFQEPQRAVAPGQSAVLYRDGVIIGGGLIATTVS
ncbi:MAG: tRNA 2-thiouridine(34) synthase MnmA, partial [Treponema sp.]|nr:tRNA 2-thiouridine(34) synthase MnmA [Treponema sp.]